MLVQARNKIKLFHRDHHKSCIVKSSHSVCRTILSLQSYRNTEAFNFGQSVWLLSRKAGSLSGIKYSHFLVIIQHRNRTIHTCIHHSFIYILYNCKKNNCAHAKIIKSYPAENVVVQKCKFHIKCTDINQNM